MEKPETTNIVGTAPVNKVIKKPRRNRRGFLHDADYHKCKLINIFGTIFVDVYRKEQVVSLRELF